MSDFQVDNVPGSLCSRLVDGRNYPPASSWPSIADIPQGALVLDSDGTVWKKDTDGLQIVSADFGEHTVLVDEEGNVLIDYEFAVVVED